MVLTDEQQKELDTTRMRPIEVTDPRTGGRFCLVPIEEYELLADQKDQDAIRDFAARTLGRRILEGE